jgi:hypothetical protein
MRAWRARATALRRPPTTGRARTQAGAAAKRSGDYVPENGPRRPPSPICTGVGPRPSPTPSAVPERSGVNAVDTQTRACAWPSVSGSADGRREHVCHCVLWEEWLSEPPVVCRRPPVVARAQFGDHRQSSNRRAVRAAATVALQQRRFERGRERTHSPGVGHRLLNLDACRRGAAFARSSVSSKHGKIVRRYRGTLRSPWRARWRPSLPRGEAAVYCRRTRRRSLVVPSSSQAGDEVDASFLGIAGGPVLAGSARCGGRQARADCRSRCRRRSRRSPSLRRRHRHANALLLREKRMVTRGRGSSPAATTGPESPSA